MAPACLRLAVAVALGSVIPSECGEALPADQCGKAAPKEARQGQQLLQFNFGSASSGPAQETLLGPQRRENAQEDTELVLKDTRPPAPTLVSSGAVQALRACDDAHHARDSERVFLMTVVDAFHGSTALMQTLMASKSFGSLCAADVWECEGGKMLEGFPENFTILELYGGRWDLSKPVLFDKSPTLLKHVEYFYDSQLRGHVGDSGTPPGLYRSHGIQRLRPAYVVMWRPLCLSQLSHNVPSEPSFNVAAVESGRLKNLVKGIRWLQDMGLPHLVVSYGRLLWSPDETQRRLQHFLPCLPGVSVDYVPSLSVDIFEGNKWKPHGSVREFGASHDPQAFGYDVAKHRCDGDWSYSRMLKRASGLFEETAKNQHFLEALSH